MHRLVQREVLPLHSSSRRRMLSLTRTDYCSSFTGVEWYGPASGLEGIIFVILLLSLSLFLSFPFCFMHMIVDITVLHTENVAREKTEFPNCRWGGEGIYNVLTFKKSRGGKSSPRGERPPLNETLIWCVNIS